MNTIMRFGSVLLIAALPVSAKANQGPTAGKHETCWTGTLSSVNTQDNTLTDNRWNRTQKFYLGQKCAISTVDKTEATLADLRPGEEVRIRYQDTEGVLVADRIAAMALRYDGAVQSVDTKAGTVTMAQAPLFQLFLGPERFHVATDCKVILSNGHNGRLADVQPGDRVSVVYELPNGSQVAYRIREKTTTADGMAQTISLPEQTLRAKLGSGEKQFAVGDHCQVMLSGDRTGHLKDVTPGQQYRFTYENVNGINVLDQIAPVQAAKTAETASLR